MKDFTKKGAVPEGRAPDVELVLLIEEFPLIRRFAHGEDVATKHQNPTIESIAFKKDKLVADFRHNIVPDCCRESRLLEHRRGFSRTLLGIVRNYRETIWSRPRLAVLIVVDDDRGVVPQQSLMCRAGIEGKPFRKSRKLAEDRDDNSGGLFVRNRETPMTAVWERKRIADETKNGYGDCPRDDNRKQPQRNTHCAYLHPFAGYQGTDFLRHHAAEVSNTRLDCAHKSSTINAASKISATKKRSAGHPARDAPLNDTAIAEKKILFLYSAEYQNKILYGRSYACRFLRFDLQR